MKGRPQGLVLPISGVWGTRFAIISIVTRFIVMRSLLSKLFAIAAIFFIATGAYADSW